MSQFEIHVHGQVQLRSDVTFVQVQEALKPLWSYSGASSMFVGSSSFYEDEPGINFDLQTSLLQICWTIQGNKDFQLILNELVLNLNELSQEAGVIEISFVDLFGSDSCDECKNEESQDNLILLFIGQNPEQIVNIQRDLAINEIILTLERHFSSEELVNIIAEVNKLFLKRFYEIKNSTNLNKKKLKRNDYFFNKTRYLH